MAIYKYINILRLSLFVYILILGNVSVSGQKKSTKDLFHTKVFLKNDSVAEGYLRNFLSHPGVYYADQINSMDSTVRINHMDRFILRKNEKYNNRDIDSLITWYDETPNIKMKWIPIPANLAFGFNTPVIYHYPLLLCLMFKGNYVSGYLGFDPMLGSRLLYLMDGMPYAKAFISRSGKLTEKRRKTLIDEFGKYPGMKDYIMGLDKKELEQDPLVILRKLDESLKGQQ